MKNVRTTIQWLRVLWKKALSSTTVFSLSSKFDSCLLSRYTTLIIFHKDLLCWLSNFLYQHKKLSTIVLCNNQSILKRLTSVFHRVLTISQWSERRSAVSPLFLHMQHQWTTIKRHFSCCPNEKFPQRHSLGEKETPP